MREQLTTMLKRHEGLRLDMYYCTAGVPTIGYGHNLLTSISEEAAEQMLQDDISIVLNELNDNVSWWTDLPEKAQIVIANMCFNIGLPRLMQFKKFWAALEDRDYERAAAEMEDSKWFHQVKGRAKELKQLMLECNEQ
jgi:lysozyme